MKRGPVIRNPALEFARANEMLLDEEIEAIEAGRMVIAGHLLSLAYLKGPVVKLYQGRRIDILANRLVGLPDDDPWS